ncbi:hypothetical protein GGR56DRAFT_674407 [Xylariaceae sp. FL0804]|nr:hypothetical protein GGR56DRAFT_674407 [Xylariaceae sp. FL0804]
MPPRTSLRRLLLVLRPVGSSSSSTTTRNFTRQTTSLAGQATTTQARPQLPFLSVPLARSHQQFRYLTTERKRWLKYELLLAVKYTVFLWTAIGLSLLSYYSLHQEYLERQYPTPDEWAFLTRVYARLANYATQPAFEDWVATVRYAKWAIARLEDPNTDGQGLEDLLLQGGGGESAGEATTTTSTTTTIGYDIAAKSEPWRRGYHALLMLCARAAEQLDGKVVDRTRRGVVVPADQVVGPSNPFPKPLRSDVQGAPREEDCEPAAESPEQFYTKILLTRGFTRRQQLDAALAYGAWLDFKGQRDAARQAHEWALALATGDDDDDADIATMMMTRANNNTKTTKTTKKTPPSLPYDPTTYVLRDDAGPPSENLLAALTGMATHRARSSDDASDALPVLVSVLRARRALPPPSARAPVPLLAAAPPQPPALSREGLAALLAAARAFLGQPPYPPAPPSGGAPPVRDARELCEEAAIAMYIGEIIYAGAGGGSNSNSNSSRRLRREEGLAWTRDAVDLAEDQLRRLKGGCGGGEEGDNADVVVQAARKTCRECLSSGLGNWAAMTARLAREERQRQQEETTAAANQDQSSWLGGLWGGGGGRPTKAEEAEATAGRWAAEEAVVRERARRAQELLEDLAPPETGFGSIFKA